MKSFIVMMIMGLLTPACSPGDDDDDDAVGDGDADADGDGDGDVTPCGTVEAGLPTCVAEGLEAPPEHQEPGCGGLGAHTIQVDFLIKDTDTRIHRDIAFPSLRMSVSGEDPLTFPVDDSLQVLVNGCEIPADAAAPYTWTYDDDDMTIVPTGGRYYVFELRERGEGGEEGGARLFYRQALKLPAVLPNIDTPATGEELPAPGRNITIPCTWDPFDMEQTDWGGSVPGFGIEMQAFIQGGGANQLIPDPNILTGIDGTSGGATFNSGLFDEWDFIRMRVGIFQQPEITASISVVRSVN